MKKITFKGIIMGNRYLRVLISMVIIALMSVVIVRFATVSTSAKSKVVYSVDIVTVKKCYSVDEIMIKINGTKGSTEWHNIGSAGSNKISSASILDKCVGEIESVTVKNLGADAWQPKGFYVSASSCRDVSCDSTLNKSVLFDGSKWVNYYSEITFQKVA